MLWLNHSEGAAPIAKTYGADGKGVPDVKGVQLGGVTWDVYSGTNGNNKVFSLYTLQPMLEVKTLDVLALVKWLQEKNYICKVFRVGKIQYGFEITETAGEATFAVNKYELKMQ